MYNSAVFLLLNSKFHNFQLNVTIHRCLRKIFFLRGGGNKFYAIFKHILFLDIYIVIGHFTVFLECDLPVTEKSFLESITKFQKTYSFLTGCEFLRFVVRHMDIKNMRHSFIPKNSDMS